MKTPRFRVGMFLVVGWFASGVIASGSTPTTYCNPISLPNYPIGRLVRDTPGEGAKSSGVGRDDDGVMQHRELADPTALWHEGRWYLYPSCDMVWVSEDEGLTWEHHPLNVRDIGYAPTVVEHAGRFLLTAHHLDLYVSDSPLGPFERLGRIRLPEVNGMPASGDPMLFSDVGRLYLYWGCTPRLGIWAVELDAANPLLPISQPFCAIPFRPDIHPWEAVGSRNQNLRIGWLEGAWMVKANGRYYLTYSAGGTQYKGYAMGCYVGETALGPFRPQSRNPILRTADGLITGTAHGCIVAGPRGRLWAFYTVRAAVTHRFERRIGVDLAAIDENGEICVPAATSTPQYLPTPGGEGGSEATDTGWLPLNEDEPTVGTSDAANLAGRLAVDNNLTTWWQPADGDPAPSLTTTLNPRATVRAVRVIWRDVGLDTRSGAHPGPFRYRVDAETSINSWTTILDRDDSDDDLLIDYRECEAVSARRARLVILGWPDGIKPGVIEFTVFGDPDAGGR